MDVKELATKVINGSPVEEVTKDLDEATKPLFYKELSAQTKAAADAEQARLAALRAERTRIETQKADVENEAVVKVRTQIRGEQVQKARAKFMAEMGLKEEDMKGIDDAFKTEDSGKFDADLIVPDLRRAYAKANSDALIEAQRLQAEQRKSAAMLNNQAATGGNPGSGSDTSGKSYSPQVLEWVREAARQGITLSPEEAERGLKGGTRRF